MDSVTIRAPGFNLPLRFASQVVVHRGRDVDSTSVLHSQPVEFQHVAAGLGRRPKLQQRCPRCKLHATGGAAPWRLRWHQVFYSAAALSWPPQSHILPIQRQCWTVRCTPCALSPLPTTLTSRHLQVLVSALCPTRGACEEHLPLPCHAPLCLCKRQIVWEQVRWCTDRPSVAARYH